MRDDDTDQGVHDANIKIGYMSSLLDIIKGTLKVFKVLENISKTAKIALPCSGYRTCI
jgi:hypothetical protein